MISIWRDVKGYEGHYRISNSGKIKTKGSIVILKTFIVDDKEEAVMLWKDGERKCYTIKTLLKDNRRE